MSGTANLADVLRSTIVERGQRAIGDASDGDEEMGVSGQAIGHAEQPA